MKTNNKKKKIIALPRGSVYLGLSDLVLALLKILTCKLRKSKKTEEFESAFGKYYGTKALALPHARVALYYLLRNLNIPKESEVIMTPITIADMVNMIHLQGLKPVFCDLGKCTYNIDCDELERKITDKTKVLFLTHLNGFSSDMEKIMRIVNRHNLFLLEDCSQAFGAKFKGKYLGTFGDAAIFSLSLLKTCSTLFGGMIISNNIDLIEKIKNETKDFPMPSKVLLLSAVLKNIVINIASSRSIFSTISYNLIRLLGNKIDKFIACNPKIPLRTTMNLKMLTSYVDIQAELGLKKLKTVDIEDEKRIKNAEILYDKVSTEVRDCLPKIINDTKNVYWRIPVRVKDAKHFIQYMLTKHIDTCQTNLVLCSQEYERYKTNTPEAYLSKFKTVFAPIHSSYNDDDMIHIAEALNDYEKSGFLS